jgi:DNA-binding CsgD family transcriptional regulator
MIGRDEDLDALRTALFDAADGNPRGVVVGGEAGIGKTRLLREFMSEAARSALVLTGQCIDLGDAGTPYGPIRSVLRGLLDGRDPGEFQAAAGPGGDALRVLLPELGPIPVDTGGDLNRLHEALTTALETAARTTPLVVVVEDVQWADDATLKVLQFMLRTMVRARVMVVLSYRSDDLARGHPVRAFLTGLERSSRVVRIELARLDRENVRHLAAAILGEAPEIAVLDRVFDRSEGVPFFVEELLGLDGACSGEALPTTLRELLLARYERLTEQTQQVLRLISVGGARVDHELLATVFTGSADVLDTAAREAIGANVLVVDEHSYAFRHALVREAVSTDLLPGERARFHTSFAEELEAHARESCIATEIAYHWYAAHNMTKAFPATLAAMAEALPTFAFGTAAQMGERALEMWDQLPDPAAVAGRSRSDLLAETADALRNTGDGERALALVELAIRESDPTDRVRRAQLLGTKATYLGAVGRPGSIPLLEEALALLPDGLVGTVRAEVLSSIASRLMKEARLSEAITVAGEALTEAQAVGSDRYASAAFNTLGISRICSHNVADGLADLERARDLAGTDYQPLLRYLVNTSDLMFLMGRHEEALRIAEEGILTARAQGVERTSGVVLTSNAVDPLHALGQWDRADELIDRMLAFEAPLAFRLYLQRARIWSTLWRGDVAAAEVIYRAWRTSMDTLAGVEVQTRLGVARVVGEMAAARGDLVGAWEQVEVLLSHDQTLPGYDLPLLFLGARVLGACWSVGEAEGVDEIKLAQREHKLRVLLAKDSSWPTAAIWTVLFEAELGGAARDGTDVDAWLLAAAVVRAPAAQAYLLPYALFRLGQARITAGDRTGAIGDLRGAIAAADRIGAGLVRAWATGVAARAGLTLEVACAGGAAPGAVLTTRERQVLALVAQGLSNRQIGERLFISAKTASVHVSSILRKLGAGSRTEAVFLYVPAGD